MGAPSSPGDYVTRRFQTLERQSFSLLRRLPSSLVRRHVLAYENLSPADRQLYAVAVGRRSATFWGGAFDPHEQSAPMQLFRKVAQELPYPTELARRTFPPAAAAELRAAARTVFKDWWGAEPELNPTEPGEWIYRGSLRQHSIAVYVSYGRRGVQLDHRISVDGRFSSGSFCYEYLYGMGVGQWDLVRTGEAIAALTLLQQTIVEAVDDVVAISAFNR